LPLYEYRCRKCGHHLEKIQKFYDSPVKTCARCGGHLERLVSAPAIRFKGSGWYVTDYARKPASSESGKSENAPTDAASASSAGDGAGKKTSEPAKTKTETKPAVKK
jgi:putative FmdB family regulatory protein